MCCCYYSYLEMKVKKKIAIWPVKDRLERLRVARQGAERLIQHRVDHRHEQTSFSLLYFFLKPFHEF